MLAQKMGIPFRCVRTAAGRVTDRSAARESGDDWPNRTGTDTCRTVLPQWPVVGPRVEEDARAEAVRVLRPQAKTI